MGNDTKVSAVAVGELQLSFDKDKILVLKDCYYVPSIRRNLISVSCLVHFGYYVHFNDSVVIKYNKLWWINPYR